MKRLISLAALLFCAAAGLFAADEPPAQHQTKSSFQLEGSRNPFWPIGWKPSANGHANIPSAAFVVTSITLEKAGHFAIINGKIMQEGQEFGLKLGAKTVQLKVKSIEDGKVILSGDDQDIIVSLRRK
jgi:hypothetical protein